MYRLGVKHGHTVTYGPQSYDDLRTAKLRADECAAICWTTVIVVKWDGLETVYSVNGRAQ